MKAFSVRKVKTNGESFSCKAGAATLLPLLCALAVSVGPAQAQEKGVGPHQEQFAGKHGRMTVKVAAEIPPEEEAGYRSRSAPVAPLD